MNKSGVNGVLLTEAFKSFESHLNTATYAISRITSSVSEQGHFPVCHSSFTDAAEKVNDDSASISVSPCHLICTYMAACTLLVRVQATVRT